MWKKASFTVEASYILPIYLCAVLFALRTGIAFFEEARTRSEIQELKRLNVVEEFYNYQILEEIIEEVKDD